VAQVKSRRGLIKGHSITTNYAVCETHLDAGSTVRHQKKAALIMPFLSPPSLHFISCHAFYGTKHRALERCGQHKYNIEQHCREKVPMARILLASWSADDVLQQTSSLCQPEAVRRQKTSKTPRNHLENATYPPPPGRMLHRSSARCLLLFASTRSQNNFQKQFSFSQSVSCSTQVNICLCIAENLCFFFTHCR
jgi:hypothetical protein